MTFPRKRFGSPEGTSVSSTPSRLLRCATAGAPGDCPCVAPTQAAALLALLDRGHTMTTSVTSDDDPLHHHVEVALVAAPAAPPRAPRGSGGPTAMITADGSVIDEKVLGRSVLERDPTRRARDVRAAGGPGSASGRRVHLRVPHGVVPLAVTAGPSAARGLPEDADDDRIMRRQMVRVTIGGLTVRGMISPPLPSSCRADDPPLERQFGTLRKDGVAVQLRFTPVCVAAASASAPGIAMGADAPLSSSPGRMSPNNTARYEVTAGAFTADTLAATGRAALAAAGPIAATTARDAAARPPAAPRSGRSPEVWEPRPIDPNHPNFDEDNPYKLAYDSRGEARNEEILAEIRRETRAWARTRDTCAALRKRLDARRVHLAGLSARKSFILQLRSRLESRSQRPKENDEDEDEDEDADDDKTVTAEDIDELRSTALVMRTTPGFSSSAVRVSFDDLGVEVDDLDGCTVSGLGPKLAECERMCAIAIDDIEAVRQEIDDRRGWDVLESGLETRDVLENGVRRADMEHKLGRPVTKVDVDASLAIPAPERMRIVGGYDIERARLTGTHEYVKRLPLSS